MSASFPSVPGFMGPLSLKTFLEDFFALKLTFGAKEAPFRVERSGNVASRAMLEVVLPVNESFLVVVYVARHATAAPPPAAYTSHHSSNCRATPAVITKEQNSVSPSPLKLNKYPSSVPTAASWLLYTQADHRPFTNALLQHPWWLLFASLLGPAAIAFVELYCPIVLQLEAMAGGVQVLGPALHHAAPPAARSNVVHRCRAIKRAREEATAVPVQDTCSHLTKKSRTESYAGSTAAIPVALPKGKSKSKSRPRSGKRGDGKLHITSQSTFSAKTASAWEAALPRTDVPRTRLYSVQDKDAADATPHDKSAVTAEEGVQPIPVSLLESLWVGRHPRSLQCAVRAALPRWQALRMERVPLLRASVAPSHSKEVESADTDPLFLPFCFVRHIFRWMRLEMPTCRNAGPMLGQVEGGSSFNVGAHLQRVLSSVLHQCSRLDLRGAALKHLRYIEERFQRQQLAKETSDIQRLAAPVDVVVAYLRTLLSTLRWPLSTDASCKGPPRCSFWGIEEAGSARVLDALLTVLSAWLSAGRHASFPTARFLDGVPVAQLPWLAGFFTNPISKSPSAARHARRQRSQIQQRVWLQFVLFLTQDVVPFLVRSSFVVIWSSKNTHQLLFFPASVWRRVVRCELRRIENHRASSPQFQGETTQADNGSCAPQSLTNFGDGVGGVGGTQVVKRLSRLCSSDQIAHRKYSATLTARNGGTSLLYAGVRFRPDGRKLRPIAVLRSASFRSIDAMTRGKPSPYSHPAALLRLLARIVPQLGVTMPPSTANVLAWVQRMSDKGKRVVALHRYRHQLSPPSCPLPHKSALRGAFQCLVSGVEEQRVRSGLPKLSNLSHQDEYAELRSFCEEARRCAAKKNEEVREADAETHGLGATSTEAAPRIFLVRSDAFRCYDNLPQSRVLEEVRALICHDAYRTLYFTAMYNSEGCSCQRVASLHRTLVSRTVPCADIANGKLSRIPRGQVYWEEESKDGKGHVGAKTALSGDAVRALLHEHLKHHLIVLNGSIFEQRVGILQGSPVAMLLCDQLFAGAVDTSLSSILSVHAERSLLLRRVDDVLVATTSSVAAQRCLQAMQRGWPSSGYRSNAKKLTMSSASGELVPWCGLLLHDTTLETSVEWRRMGPVLSSLRVADALKVHCGDREPLLFTQRLLAVVHLRVPPTALCGRINSKGRQLRTFYEAALLWSRLIVWKVHETLATAHHRCVAVLLLRPLAACIARLCRLLRRHHEFLTARQSGCDVCSAEVRACVLAALHRTLQAKLRVLVLRPTRLAGGQQRRRQKGPRGQGEKKWKKGPRGKNVRCTGGTPRERGHCNDSKCSTSPSSLRAFWWCAASQIEAQWCGSLAVLERVDEQKKSREEYVESKQGSAAATADLLRDDGPSSLHMQSLHAMQQLFRHDADSAGCPKAA
ncbi:putative Telomerase reverse transcriptase [Leptomonas seymouri]|uniref:Telomerase reverse transcriptase n=1 Tax=Leptomonas seymouri TaxID=5684 RepID=A0A0N1HXN9_LEPSE|nr:putative Telomerase reverse transcriptase [Leptomonas seymouri]|eukprot:KPI87294.1 putative Telomerase reverse transcriptase [Leptomonas seymouri]